MDKNNIEKGTMFQAMPYLVKSISPEYIERQRWFGSKSRKIKDITLYDAGALNCDLPVYILVLIEIGYVSYNSEIYYLPLVVKSANLGRGDLTSSMDNLIARTKIGSTNLLIFDALQDEGFLKLLFNNIVTSSSIDTLSGKVLCKRTNVLNSLKHSQIDKMRHINVEQSNTSIVYNEKFILKNFRHISNGINPDLEIPLFLTTKTDFINMPLVAGYIEYHRKTGFLASVAILQNFVKNQGDGWKYTTDYLRKFYSFVRDHKSLTPGYHEIPPESKGKLVQQFWAKFLQEMYHLGEVTGKMHNALASYQCLPEFAPEPITMGDILIWTAQIKSFISEVMLEVSHKSPTFALPLRNQIDNLLLRSKKISKHIEALDVIAKNKMCKIRYHNDYHLGQVLKTQNDFMIIDFEGEPLRSLQERRSKHSPLKDVAGMLRSFNYARYSVIFEINGFDSDRSTTINQWGNIWERQVSRKFLDGYFNITLGDILEKQPKLRKDIQRALTAFQIEKAVYELKYELNNRPAWITIPLKYLQYLTN